VGIILEVKVGEKVDAGSVLCRLYYTKEDRVEEAAEMVEDAFRISAQKPEERELILEVVGVRWAATRGSWASLSSWRSPGCAPATSGRFVCAPWPGGFGLQFAFALLVLKTPFSQVLRAISSGVAALFGYANVGSAFVFGKLADSEAVQRAFGTPQENVGVIFAFQVLPIIIFIASLFSILYYLGSCRWWCARWRWPCRR